MAYGPRQPDNGKLVKDMNDGTYKLFVDGVVHTIVPDDFVAKSFITPYPQPQTTTTGTPPTPIETTTTGTPPSLTRKTIAANDLQSCMISNPYDTVIPNISIYDPYNKDYNDYISKMNKQHQHDYREAIMKDLHDRMLRKYLDKKEEEAENDTSEEIKDSEEVALLKKDIDQFLEIVQNLNNIIKVLEEKNTELEDRINKTWDYLSERIEKLEKRFWEPGYDTQKEKEKKKSD